MVKKEYLNEILQCCREIRNGEKTYHDMDKIFKKYEIANFSSIDSLRRVFKIFNIFDEAGYIQAPKDYSYKETTGIEANGNLVSDKLIELSDIDKNSPESILKAHGFNPLNFKLVSCRNSIWNFNSKKEGLKNLYSSKIVVKPYSSLIDFNYLDKYFQEKEFTHKREIPKYKDANNSEEILEIDVADFHIGLLSDENEVGESYNTEIAIKYFNSCIDEIIQKSKGRKFNKIIFVNLGDFIHVNNNDGTTAKGTKQDVCGRVTSIFIKALDMLIECIEKLLEIAPVEVVSVSGNHDRETSFYLFTSLQKAFRKDERVTFNVGPNPFKAKRYKNVLLGWTHGDLKKENYTDWLQVHYSKDYGNSKWREIHSGHIHSQGIIDKSGVLVRFLPKLCSASAWEHTNGYNAAIKSMVSFVWNVDEGLEEIWFSKVKERE